MKNLIGKLAASVVTGESISELEGRKEAREILEHQANMRKVACSARELFRETGHEDSVEFRVFDGLTKSAEWYPQFDELLEPFMKVISGNTETIEEHTKQANIVKGVGAVGKGLTRTASNIFTSVPELWKYVLSSAAILGGAAGTAGWAVNRLGHQDDAENERLENRIDFYKNLSHEISAEMKNKQLGNKMYNSVDSAKKELYG